MDGSSCGRAWRSVASCERSGAVSDGPIPGAEAVWDPGSRRGSRVLPGGHRPGAEAPGILPGEADRARTGRAAASELFDADAAAGRAELDRAAVRSRVVWSAGPCATVILPREDRSESRKARPSQGLQGCLPEPGRDLRDLRSPGGARKPFRLRRDRGSPVRRADADSGRPFRGAIEERVQGSAADLRAAALCGPYRRSGEGGASPGSPPATRTRAARSPRFRGLSTDRPRSRVPIAARDLPKTPATRDATPG